MGFYAPAQLVGDARRNGVAFRPVDVQLSDWDCTLERGVDDKPEVRLGLRLVSGLPEAQGTVIEEQRRAFGPYAAADDLAHRGNLPRRSLALLAQAGALNSIAGHRRQAHWSAIGVETLPGALAGASASENRLPLPPPTEGEDIIADYRSLGLTLGRHPLALLRGKLERLRVYRAAELITIKSGCKVRIAGIVTHRQRPETASGVVFMSLEDETGISNLIVWPSVQATQRQAVFLSHLLIVQGELQSEMGVIHVIAEKVRDYSHWLGTIRTESRDFR
jgi:error-prone DNA polymerase